MVLLNGMKEGSSAGYLQNGKKMMSINLHMLMVVVLIFSGQRGDTRCGFVKRKSRNRFDPFFTESEEVNNNLFCLSPHQYQHNANHFDSLLLKFLFLLSCPNY